MAKAATRPRVRANEVVRVRIDAATKAKATAVLEEIGMTPSDAVRLLLRKIAREEALPFAPLVPNKVTLAAMEESRKRSSNKRFDTIEALKTYLDEDD